MTEVRGRGGEDFSGVMILVRRVEVLPSAIPPYIIVILFTRLEKRHVLFCVTILASATTRVTVFK